MRTVIIDTVYLKSFLKTVISKKEEFVQVIYFESGAVSAFRRSSDSAESHPNSNEIT